LNKIKKLLDKLSTLYYVQSMKTLTVGKLKSDFSNILKTVDSGEDIIIEYGREHKKIAVIIPYKSYISKPKSKRKIGFLKGKASFEIKKDFKISDEDLISL
jgi:antitoxin (DNA-binding transcriptional repressor) of toxin-antitoxin stability system